MEIKVVKKCPYKVDMEIRLVSKFDTSIIKEVIDAGGIVAENFNYLPGEHIFDNKEKTLYYIVPCLSFNISTAISFAKLARIIKKFKVKRVSIDINPIIREDPAMLGLLLGSYTPTYIGNTDTKDDITLYFCVWECLDSAKESYKYASILANSINTTRTIVNTPANKMNTTEFAEWCSSTTNNKRKNLTSTVLNKDDILKESMFALYEVSKGSVNPPAVVCMEYKPKNPLKRIALVGKGVIYDTGGLSIKPSDSMATMKMDKAGAEVVRSVIRTVAELQLENVEVVGVVGIVENSISNTSYRPGDIIYSKSGKTIEITNTDAEGRLVLADCLTYAQEKYELDFIIDVATLTGACRVGLGEHTYGVFGNDRDKLNRFHYQASYNERCETIRLDHSLDNLLDSKLADMINCPSAKYGGAITAGLFLERFIENENRNKWLHIDICGPAYTDKEWDFHPAGATGAGIIGIIEYIKYLDKLYKEIEFK